MTPVVTLDREKTEQTRAACEEIFGGVVPVEVRGVQGFWFAPIDDVVMYMGTNELLMNTVMDPDLIHAPMKKITDAYM